MVEQGTHKPLAGGSNPPSATTPLETPSPAPSTRGAAAPGDPATMPPSSSPSPAAPTRWPSCTGRPAWSRPMPVRWRLTVAHLDHGLRDDSADDARFVADAAEGLALRYEFLRTDVAALARAEGRSIEDAGREARYRFLEEVAPEGALIATAHTADDAAETVLLNLLRGSGLAGARGIPARRGRDRAAPPRRAARDPPRVISMRRASATGWIRRTRTRPSFATASATRSSRCSSRSVPARRSASVSSRDWPRTTTALLDDLARAELPRRTTDVGIDWREPPRGGARPAGPATRDRRARAERGARRGADGGGGRRARWRARSSWAAAGPHRSAGGVSGSDLI